MAEETEHITISKNNSGFPDYLDFDKLRTEGIDYLGRLTGKIWTDYNVHDPGITILEVLCYALLDLGYRTNLPIADILTRDPEDNSADNNFFTPAQILTNNPLTIIDFRKLLIDIEGISNAWLEVATDQVNFCRKNQQPDPNGDPAGAAIVLPPRENGSDCIDYLNGLYHVYIDLDTGVEKELENKTTEEKEAILEEKSKKVKAALMAHRNLCEDFIDIHILCKQEIGVCADIELESSADAEQVYIAVVEKLAAFFSPSPQFYTLQQMLDKQKTIDEIFAGRPYNITESHGFTDTAELELLTLRKEIHLSDVYHVILGLEGVEGVNGLGLQSCDNNVVKPESGWKYQVPENHVTEFSLNCSGFRFTKNGRPVFVDTKKFEGLFSISFSNNGKIPYKAPSPYLDCTVPQGVYRADLADYYSIQNEFPRVYGIAEGGLSENASAERKAQAYQLKAWLLFFDQLLANYLAQLKDIRNLFTLSAPEENSNHTYFISQLTNVPDHQKLVRFNLSENNNSSLGTEGSVLVTPVYKKDILRLIEQDQLKWLEIEDVPSCTTKENGNNDNSNTKPERTKPLKPYTFRNLAEQNTAISQLKTDLYCQQYQVEYITKHNDCIFYYVFTGSDEIALICKKYFKDKAAAKEHADTLPYIGSFDENYNSFINTNGSFSFNISLNLLSFSKYLQLIVEDKALFVKRRQGFLNHLLARFAEQFTDYALLSFDFQSPGNVQVSEIKHKENYLTNYADLSSNRGKAYNYLEHKWNNENISGFEKRVKAFGGINDPDRRSLCNFMVAKYDETFAVTLKMAGASYFTTVESADTFDDGLEAAQSIFMAMKELKNYQTKEIEHDENFVLELNYGDKQKAVFQEPFVTENEAMETAKRLTGLYVKKEPESTVFESSYIYIPELRDASRKLMRSSIPSYGSEEEAKSAVMKTILNIDDRELWRYDESGAALGLLHHISFVEDYLSFINVSAFKIDIDNSIIDKPDVFTYELLDKGNTFKFITSNEFQSEEEARQDAYALLALLTSEATYEIFADRDNRYGIQIRNQEGIAAVCSNDAGSEEEAIRLKNRILNFISRHRYDIDIDKEANLWKFNYDLGYHVKNLHHFESVVDYNAKSDAIQAAATFIEIEPYLMLQNENGLILTARPGEAESITVRWISVGGDMPASGIDQKVNDLLEEKKELIRLNKDSAPKDFEGGVHPDDKSRQGLYVYRLVDKDNIPAFYSKEFDNADAAKPELKELAKRFKYPNDYLEICMGGEHIIHKIKEEKLNKYWYHYQIRALDTICNSNALAQKSLVLFESVKGYASEEEAELAFKENYLHILHLASDETKYGVDKEISPEEIRIHDDESWKKTESVVFIPKTTLDELGGDLTIAIKKLVNISLLYPIRKVVFESREFYGLFFPCMEAEETDNDSCKKENKKYVYYFILRSRKEENTACEEPLRTEKWQSTKYFDTPEAAGKEFNFFRLLLNYAGNYFVDCSGCTNDIFHVYIREVLAEGTERFIEEKNAWGDEGVQKFICITQSEGAFHTYQRQRDCCCAFYVSCSDSIIYHPCKYDTEQRRDNAKLKLYQLLKEAIKKKSWQVDGAEEGLLLLNKSGEAFARVEQHSNDDCWSDIIAVLSKNSDDKEHFKEEEGKCILTDDSGNRLAISTKDEIELDEWIALLKEFLCMYPVVRIWNEETETYKYCIEIKLPEFNTCKEDIAEENPCGCGEKMEEEHPDCFVAWKSRCCYDNCWEAERTLETYIKLLQQYDFYQPVFDCVCNSFGITLQFEKISIIANQNVSHYDGEANIVNWRNSEIVAINPQCYPSKEDACDGVGRAKKLINSEGLHVVEHILLRPHCPDDCQCREYNRHCDETGCEFKWNIPGEDPCLEERENYICFVPGTDPYSFIATIVLPAWPERFRKKENRELLEHIIFRETPAHILIRILWLSPHDLCCFECQCKNWIRWLARKKNCIDGFSVCNFMEFLFNRNYECLDECNVCKPCTDKSVERQPCFEDSAQTVDVNAYLNQINKVFCWQWQDCKAEYTDCIPKESEPGDDKPDTPGILREDESHPVAIESTEFKKTKPQAVNARLMKYKKKVESVVNNSAGNPIALKAQSFMTDPQPEYERLSKLVTEILENKTPRSKQVKALSHKQQEDLLENVICFWLDRHCFDGKDMNEMQRLREAVAKIENEKINSARIFKYWNFSEIKHYEPELDEGAFRNIFNEK